MCVCVCVCLFIALYILYTIYTGLEIGGCASPDANHFWGICESLAN